MACSLSLFVIRLYLDTARYIGLTSLILFQVIHFRLAELQTELELLRALTYQAADTMMRYNLAVADSWYSGISN